MFYANLGAMPRKVSCYVMNYRVILDVVALVSLFAMDGSPLCLLNKDHPHFNREEALNLLFPGQTLDSPSGKIYTSKLSFVAFHYCQMHPSPVHHTTSLVEDDIFLLWALKQ